MMTRVLVSIGAIAVAMMAMVSALLDRTGVTDWVERLHSSETYTSVSTTTAPISLAEEPIFSIATDTPTVETRQPPIRVSTPTPRIVKSAPSPIAKTPVPPTPAVVRTDTPSSLGAISEKAIVDLTNVERVREGKTILVWNEKLAQMAYQKAKDMLDRQYFAHESPDGKNVAGLAKDAEYLYRLVGENLAVGNFRTNEELIAGWMGSPGHRENMLKSEYTEMGTAAIEGIFEGERVWMAVQEFGKPFPACAKPDAKSKEDIASQSDTLASLDGAIGIARTAIETATDEATRLQKIADYNTLIELYNSLVADTKTLVNTYNESVRNYNSCIEA